MAFYNEQIVPKPVDEDYQPFSAAEEQLAPGEEVYDIKQEFVDDAYIQEDLGQGKIASPSSDDESTVFNSTTDQVSSDEEAYDIKKEFVGTCYEDLPAIKTEPVSDYECDNPEDSDYDATLDEPDSTDATLEEPSTCEELEELEGGDQIGARADFGRPEIEKKIDGAMKIINTFKKLAKSNLAECRKKPLLNIKAEKLRQALKKGVTQTEKLKKKKNAANWAG